MQATPENSASLDYIQVRGKAPACLSKSLKRLPFRGARMYHACAVRFMLKQHHISYSDLGLGLRASGRLPHNVFRAPLDAIEEAKKCDLAKLIRALGIRHVGGHGRHDLLRITRSAG